MSLNDVRTSYENAILAEYRERLRGEIETAISMALAKVFGGHVSSSVGAVSTEPVAPRRARRNRKVDVKITDEQVETVAAFLTAIANEAEPHLRHVGAKPSHMHIGAGFNRKNIAACCRELVKLGRATEHRGYYAAVLHQEENIGHDSAERGNEVDAEMES